MTATAQERIQKYIDNHHVLVLSTGGDGGPWSTSLFYAPQGMRLYFLSNPRTRHGQHLEQDPRVAAAITEPYADWTQIQGVQLEGEVRAVTGALERARVLARYVAHFPSVGAALRAGGGLAVALAKAKFYELRIARAWMTDNPSGFGTRWHVDLTGPPD